MNRFDFMTFEIKRETSEHGVPYVEARWEMVFDEMVEISFRRYPKRTFVAFEDDRGNPSGGVDLSDCWIAPAYIFAKVDNYEFEPLPMLYNLLVKLFGPMDEAEWRQYESAFVTDLRQALVWPVRVDKLVL